MEKKSSFKQRLGEIAFAMKSLLRRNALLIVIFYAFLRYSTLMKYGFRSLVAQVGCGMNATEMALCSTLFSLSGIIFSAPIGAFIDKHRDKLKKVTIWVALLNAVVQFLGFGFASSKAFILITYFVDGFFFALTSVLVPAILAITVDKKVMGTAVAIWFGLANFVSGTARSLGISMFNNVGQLPAAAVCAAIAFVGTILLFFLDTEDMSRTLLAEKASGAAPVKTKRRGLRNFFEGWSWVAFPFALAYGITSFWGTIRGNYMAIYMKGFEYEWLGTMAAANSAFGLVTIFTGVLCDFMSPIVLSVISMVSMATGAWLIGTTASQAMVHIGIWCVIFGGFYQTTLKIAAMKVLPYREQGGVQATFAICAGLANTLGPIPIGMLVDAVGYSNGFKSSTFLTTGALIFFLIAYFRRKKKTEREMAEEALASEHKVS